jgi:TolB-like protein
MLVALGVSLALVMPASAQDVRASVDELASQIAKAAPAGKQLRIAVADFPNLQGMTCDLGRYVANRLTTRLAQNTKFFVIERQRLNQVLAELKFSMSDLVDPSKAKRLGQMAGVEAIVVGTISDVGNQVDVDARIIEIETNRTLLGATITVGKDPTVMDMQQRGCQSLEAAAPAPPPRPGTPPGATALRGLHYSNAQFAMMLQDFEVTGDQIKLTLVYTNRGSSQHYAQIWGKDINSTYLVDNLGQRYEYRSDSLGGGRRFSPEIPERIWISFAKPQASASHVNLVVRWSPGGENVLIRNIPLK